MEKPLQILGALYFIKNNGYNHPYSRIAAERLRGINVVDYHEAIKLTPNPNDFRCFLNWEKINKLSGPSA